MKKYILYYLAGATLVLFSSYTFLTASARALRGGDPQLFSTLFVISLFLHLLYYLWLIVKIKPPLAHSILYIPSSFMMFIVFMIFIVSPPWIKEVRFDMGPDPFSEDTTITGGFEFNIFEKAFWSNTAREKVRQQHLHQMRTARQGSLIQHVGTSLQGWSDEKIRHAFGEPASITEVEEGLEKWIYHPWADSPDWEMPVYVQNGELLKIGD